MVRKTPLLMGHFKSPGACVIKTNYGRNERSYHREICFCYKTLNLPYLRRNGLNYGEMTASLRNSRNLKYRLFDHNIFSLTVISPYLHYGTVCFINQAPDNEVRIKLEPII